jgi:hypothetical protein
MQAIIVQREYRFLICELCRPNKEIQNIAKETALHPMAHR